MSIQTTYVIDPGDSIDIILQSPLRGSGAPADYAPGDVLSGRITASKNATPVLTLTPSWFTDPDANGNPQQDGYSQGQTITTLQNADTANWPPGMTYTLDVFRQMASAPGRKERIASALITVRRVAP